MLTTKYQTLLEDTGLDAGKAGADLVDGDRRLLTHYLNEAVKWVWRDGLIGWTHPDTVTDGALAITDGRIAAALIDHSTDFVTVFTSDPRVKGSPRRRLAHQRDASGIVITDPEAGATAYCFWRGPRPVFTHTAVVPATTYPAGSLVYDVTLTGHVYKAKVTALGSELADPTKWVAVTLPESLAGPARFYARWKWLLSKDLQVNASTNLRTAQDALHEEMQRQTPLPFWLEHGSHH
jgi:hypothetical protein